MTDKRNPIRRDECRRNLDCFLNSAKPHIELLANASPGSCQWMDIDGTIECKGNFLFLEWKEGTGELSQGQEIYYRQLTKISPRITAIVAVGDPIKMDPIRIRFIHNGKVLDWIASSHEHFLGLIEKWGERVYGGIAA